MEKNKNKKHVYRSMFEFEKKFFPNSFKKMEKEPKDAQAIGISMAKESLKKIREGLAQKG